jgi:hypothetical protein
MRAKMADHRDVSDDEKRAERERRRDEILRDRGELPLSHGEVCEMRAEAIRLARTHAQGVSPDEVRASIEAEQAWREAAGEDRTPDVAYEFVTRIGGAGTLLESPALLSPGPGQLTGYGTVWDRPYRVDSVLEGRSTRSCCASRSLMCSRRARRK